jgi:2-hydroxy fatty acid dioxygenase
VLLEPVAGAMISPFILASAAIGNYLVPRYGMDANYAALGIHVVSWIAQFIGHGKFEGRAPALLDNLVQALFLAPLFVWLEYLFRLGYRPELKSRLDTGVQKEIAKFRAQKGKEAVNGKTK